MMQPATLRSFKTYRQQPLQYFAGSSSSDLVRTAFPPFKSLTTPPAVSLKHLVHVLSFKGIMFHDRNKWRCYYLISKRNIALTYQYQCRRARKTFLFQL